MHQVRSLQTLGPSPRDRLVGTNFLGNQFPDGFSFPILACYYPNGRTVTCAIWQIQAYIFPFWNYPRGYDVLYSTSGLEKIGYCFWFGSCGIYYFGKVFLRLAMSFWPIHGRANTNPQSLTDTAFALFRKNKHGAWTIKVYYYCGVFDSQCYFWFICHFWH